MTDSNRHTTSYKYNADGELTEIHRPDTSVLRNEYWPNGLLRHQFNGDNQRTSYDYNAL